MDRNIRTATTMLTRGKPDAGTAAAPEALGEGTPCALDPRALYRLMTWLSPAYPIGAFSYSGGIEWSVEAGDIRDAATLQSWLTVMIADGGGYCDGVFFAHAYRAAAHGDDTTLRAVAELAAAFNHDGNFAERGQASYWWECMRLCRCGDKTGGVVDANPLRARPRLIVERKKDQAPGKTARRCVNSS